MTAVLAVVILVVLALAAGPGWTWGERPCPECGETGWHRWFCTRPR